MAYIFVADENALVLDLISTFLSEDGHQLLSARTAEDLVSMTKGGDRDPDLMIISADIEPGFLAELLYDLRECAGIANLPFLILVPPGASDVEMDIQGIPAVEVIHKPFDRGSFLARVRGVLLMAGSPMKTASGVESTVELEEVSSPLENPEPVQPAAQSFEDMSLSVKDHAQAVLTEQVQAWLAEEGRLIMEYETQKMLRESYAKVVENVVWKVVPEMAEEMLRAEIQKLTKELEN